MDNFDVVCESVIEYVNTINVESYENIALMMHCTDIILGEKDFNFNYKYKKKYDFKQIDKYVEEFLFDLNPDYLEYYRLRKTDGTIELDYNNNCGEAYSTYDDELGKRVIYVSVTGTIEDAFSIVHELFHDINLRYELDSYGRYFFTECLSLLGEFLFSDFLSKKNVVEYNNVVNRCLYYLRKKALEVNFNLRLIQEYLDNGYIDKNIITNLIMSYCDYYREDLIEIIYNISEQEWLTLEEDECYILSGLSATYMYDRIKNNKKNLNELFDLNDALNDFDLGQVLDYLDLNHNDYELTPDSYNVLRKSYKKFIKR